ncbi:MAG: glycosyltransferase family protein [Planctomycetota bacterium]|jgi:hypothetical protein
MKVLHIDNTAFVGETLMRYFNNNTDIHIDVLAQIHDERYTMMYAGITDYIYLNQFGDHALLKKLNEIQNNYDVFHVHANPRILQWLSQFNKPIIYHAHGSDVRFMPKGLNFLQYADHIVVATEDLLKYFNVMQEVDYIPNTADRNHFQADAVSRLDNTMLIKNFAHGNLDNLRINSMINKLGLHNKHAIKFQRRDLFMFPYSVYPRYLEVFEYFFDYKFVRGIEQALPFSLTGLQFLALGGKVYHRDHITQEDKLYTKLPKEFEYDIVMKQWNDLYNNL